MARCLPTLAAAILLAAHGSAVPQASPSDSALTIGSTCSATQDCSQIENSFCNGTRKVCDCAEAFPIENGGACLGVSKVGEKCIVTAQCRPSVTGSECGSGGTCACRAKHSMFTYADGTKICHGGKAKSSPVDPAMIGILVSLVLMFLIICVVLQLFSKARFRQNRTILNSANPRLMNTSFLKGDAGQLSAGGASRASRGSRSSLETADDGSLAEPERSSSEQRAGDTDGLKTELVGGRDSVLKQMTIEVAENGQ